MVRPGGSEEWVYRGSEIMTNKIRYVVRSPHKVRAKSPGRPKGSKNRKKHENILDETKVVGIWNGETDMWTKKDFIILAEIIAESEDKAQMVANIIDECKRQNPNFDEDKFMHKVKMISRLRKRLESEPNTGDSDST